MRDKITQVSISSKKRDDLKRSDDREIRGMTTRKERWPNKRRDDFKKGGITKRGWMTFLKERPQVSLPQVRKLSGKTVDLIQGYTGMKM